MYNVLLYISPPIFWERGGFPSARSNFYCFYLFFPCLLILSYHHKVNLQRLNCRGVTDVEQTDLQVGAGEIVSPITLDSVRCGFRRFGGIAERSSVLVSAGWNRWIKRLKPFISQRGFFKMILTSALRALAEWVKHWDLGAGEQHWVEIPGHQQDAGGLKVQFIMWTKLIFGHRRRWWYYRWERKDLVLTSTRWLWIKTEE